ncbi:MAG: hypothetical protein ACYDCC_15645 [Actinomycetota bacterium]
MNPDQFLIVEAGRRSQTDYRFAWGAYIGWTILTLGIFGHFATYKLIERRNEHIKRRLAFCSYLWHCLAERADAANKREQVQPGLDNLSRIYSQIESYDRQNPRDPLLWMIVRIFVRICGGFINNFLNKDLRFLDTWESSFAQNVEWIGQQLDLRIEIGARKQIPERDPWRYALYTVITLGVYAIVWRYRTMEDGNLHFDEDDRAEDAILKALGLTTVR